LSSSASTFGIGSVAGVLQFYDSTNAAERMRIDSSGNLLVGKTSTAIGTAGATLWSDGLTDHTRSGEVLRINRLSTDGDIVTFRKDGTTVGSIGSVGGVDLNIGTDTTGLRFYDGSNADGGTGIIVPWNVTANSARDAQMNLGSSTERFRNLYLSGGVYLGGTGSANKLDDYEEGTFTPVVRDASSGGNTASSYLVATGRYTKVGRMVHATINFVNIDTTGMTSGNSVYITGLPFTAVNSFGYPTVPVNVSAVSSTNGFVRGSVFYNADYLSLSEGTTTGGAALTVSDLTSGDADIYINFSYEVQ
jgi:hypothetical protein